MTSVAQRKILLGRESPPGTPATPDVAIRGKMDFQVVPDKVQVRQYVGSFAPDRFYVGSIAGVGKLSMSGYYQHLPIIISMGTGDPLSGGNATSLGSGRYRYSFTLAESGVYSPQFITYTIEYADGNAHIVRSSDVFATGLEVSGEAGGSWHVSADLVGAETTFPETPSDDVAVPAVTPVLMAETNLYVSDNYVDIASGLVPATLVSFVWRLEKFQHQKQFAGSMYPGGRGNSVWDVSLELILEVDKAIVQSEKAKLSAIQQTAIRLRSVSPNGHAAGVPYLVNLDGVYILMDMDTLDVRNGNNTIKLTYAGTKDTNGFTGRFFMDTNLSEL